MKLKSSFTHKLLLALLCLLGSTELKAMSDEFDPLFNCDGSKEMDQRFSVKYYKNLPHFPEKGPWMSLEFKIVRPIIILIADCYEPTDEEELKYYFRSCPAGHITRDEREYKVLLTHPDKDGVTWAEIWENNGKLHLLSRLSCVQKEE